MTIALHTTTISRASLERQGMEIELPDDAIITSFEVGSAFITIVWYRYVVRPSTDPTR